MAPGCIGRIWTVKIYALDFPEDVRRYNPPRMAETIPHARQRLPRREPDLHLAFCTAEFDDEDVHAEAHSSDKRVLQEMVEFSRDARASLRLVWLLQPSHEPQRSDSGDGCGSDDSGVGIRDLFA